MSPARRHPCHAIAALLAAAVLLSAAVPAARAQETEHEEEFSYIPGDEHGPEHWGRIKEEWAACGTGRLQSPIDLSHERVSLVRSLGYLHHSYRPAEASIVNRGHDIMVCVLTSDSYAFAGVVVVIGIGSSLMMHGCARPAD